MCSTEVFADLSSPARIAKLFRLLLINRIAVQCQKSADLGGEQGRSVFALFPAKVRFHYSFVVSFSALTVVRFLL